MSQEPPPEQAVTEHKEQLVSKLNAKGPKDAAHVKRSCALVEQMVQNLNNATRDR